MSLQHAWVEFFKHGRVIRLSLSTIRVTRPLVDSPVSTGLQKEHLECSSQASHSLASLFHAETQSTKTTTVSDRSLASLQQGPLQHLTEITGYGGLEHGGP